uniref:Zinc knuckle CX2CX4HX4C domain-containing protein n=1 Tax=Manihot esculenta TaxID=3983 RepID=A0A199U9H5_MANES
MAIACRPDPGMFVKELDNNVLNDGPWSFMQHLLILKELKPRENPRAVELTHMEIWIQVHNLHSCFMSQTIARTVGEYMESFVSSNEKNFTGFWKEYMRVRRKMQLSKRGVDWFWADFKYERFPTFCYFCGVIGHTDRFCSKLYDLPPISRDKYMDIGS